MLAESLINDPQIAVSHELKITRTFDAPRELVWKVWTDPEMAKHWMGPRGFQTTEFVTSSESDARWHLTMEGNVPGTDKLVELRQGGVIMEVKPPELLVYTFAWEDRSSVGLTESPYKENVVTVRFEDHGDKTVMHFHQAPFATEGERDGHTGGWNSAFDCLADAVQSEQPGRIAAPGDVPSELHLKRFFSAPRQLVFDAWTKPEMLQQWWGPKCFSNPVCEVDPKQGGEIRIHMQAPDSTIYPMTGRFLQVHPPYRFHFICTPLNDEGDAIFEQWTSVVFNEVDGGTEISLDVHIRTSTPEAAKHLRGMNEGWSQSLERLQSLLTEDGDQSVK